MDVHYYQLPACLKLFHNKKLGLSLGRAVGNLESANSKEKKKST